LSKCLWAVLGFQEFEVDQNALPLFLPV